MSTIGTATHGALNLQAINNFLKKTITPARIADKLDMLMLNYICIIKDSNCATEPVEISKNIYLLTQLRSLFTKIALDNNETPIYQSDFNEFDLENEKGGNNE